MEGGGGTSSNPMRMALLSPEAPEEVASAASEKIVTFRLRPAVSCITSHCSRVKRGWSAGSVAERAERGQGAGRGHREEGSGLCDALRQRNELGLEDEAALPHQLPDPPRVRQSSGMVAVGPLYAPPVNAVQ